MEETLLTGQSRIDERLERLTSQSYKNATHIEIINRELGEVRDNIAIIQLDVSSVKSDIATLKNDVVWFKKFFWATFGAALTATALQVLQMARVINTP